MFLNVCFLKSQGSERWYNNIKRKCKWRRQRRYTRTYRQAIPSASTVNARWLTAASGSWPIDDMKSWARSWNSSIPPSAASRLTVHTMWAISLWGLPRASRTSRNGCTPTSMTTDGVWRIHRSHQLDTLRQFIIYNLQFIIMTWKRILSSCAVAAMRYSSTSHLKLQYQIAYTEKDTRLRIWLIKLR